MDRQTRRSTVAEQEGAWRRKWEQEVGGFIVELLLLQ
jgi:hypothetical protein